jgi:glc operon protein GlcG
MFKLLAVMLSLVATASSVAAPSSIDLPTRKYLNLAAIKIMVAAAEAEAKKQNVEVTICIVDESGNLLFLQKADGASLNTIQFAQKKARHAAFYRAPSKSGADAMKRAMPRSWLFPISFPIRAVCRFSWTARPSAELRPAAPSLRSTKLSHRLDSTLFSRNDFAVR